MCLGKWIKMNPEDAEITTINKFRNVSNESWQVRNSRMSRD